MLLMLLLLLIEFVIAIVDLFLKEARLLAFTLTLDNIWFLLDAVD